MHEDEGFPTETSKEADIMRNSIRKDPLFFHKDTHLEYILAQARKEFPLDYDVIVPWLASWISNALYVLLGGKAFFRELFGGKITFLQNFADQVIKMQVPGSGFSGGKNQLPNLGNTYAALAFLHAVKRIQDIDKEGAVAFIRKMRVESGFTMYEDGEIDPRAIYCAVASYSILHSKEVMHIDQTCPFLVPGGEEIFAGIPEIISRLQTYEGGFAASPGEEAHGGYTFCAVAALKILNSEIPNEENLKKWLLSRQNQEIPGFNGRTNKSPDSCYNFWVGASYKMCALEIPYVNLLTFTVGSCQAEKGGIKSVPSSRPDVYHTACSLLGMHIATETDFNHLLGIPAVLRMGSEMGI
ncbi:protein farnesyltransferase subunit beta [Nematocida major]|uniref:protein farnesyltransferase subunit beta n=1 Tax=Nematocida major TaxID=1912982 RepID=UPI00200761AA|nr:protein farnesyltransferase subunit beta [Nematocida major]KAH9385298.1 protein farnesyltransferase subunit beta [Nematocida major]